MSAVDLTMLDWVLTGWRPFAWKLRKSAETGGFLEADHGPFPARLPGSVQENLRRAGAIPDWSIGRNSLLVEWVEHRQWMFATTVPPLGSEEIAELVFLADGLDASGWVLIDGVEVGQWSGAHRPVRIEVGAALGGPGPHELTLVFDLPPEGQGQMGYTSRAREMKPRYSYGWDWCVRMVPIGAAGRLRLVNERDALLRNLGVVASLSADLRAGTVEISGGAGEEMPAFEVLATLRFAGQIVVCQNADFISREVRLTLAVSTPTLWWPQGEGAPALYELELTVSRDGRTVESETLAVGFKHIEWRGCAGAPPDALPWLCVVNGRPIFLQGVNWTPVRMGYMDATSTEVKRLVGIYRELGCNLLRVWGGSTLESPEFYAACDRAGLLVWQEFPLSSSGIDSHPPSDAAFVAELCEVARRFIRSRRHHACLLMWCGGNELNDEERVPDGKRRVPLTRAHPVLAALAAVVAQEDPGRRFLPTSPFGPRFHSERVDFGRGLHHDVHGPWGVGDHPEPGAWERYWCDDDALFRGETGVAGASRLELIRAHAGSEAVWPPITPLWHHASGWWTQWDRLAARFEGMEDDKALAAYVEFTRREQAEKLAFAARAKKAQFPRCGGFLIWMGHDAFPCLANTSIVEFDHSLKPAAHAVAAVFHAPPGKPT